MDKNPPASVGNMGSIPGPGRFHTLRSNGAQAPQLLKAPWPRTCAVQPGKPRLDKPVHHSYRAAPSRCSETKPELSNEDSV